MTFYTDARTTANSLIDTYGQSITFTRDAKGTFVPGTGVTETPTTYTADVMSHPYSLSEINDTTIKTGDMQAFVTDPLDGALAAVVPAIDDTCPIDGTTWRVMSVQPINPGGTVVMYVLSLRS